MKMNRPTPSSKARLPARSAKSPQWRTAETKVVLERLSNSLRRALADHQTMLEILLQRRAELPLEIGELFEDASNAYMEMSESVSQKFLTTRSHIPE